MCVYRRSGVNMAMIFVGTSFDSGPVYMEMGDPR